MEQMKLLYTRKEAAHALGVSLRTIDHLTRRGSLSTRRIGSKTLIPHDVLRKYAASDHPEAVTTSAA